MSQEPDNVLRYQSRSEASLRPGETLLWQGEPSAVPAPDQLVKPTMASTSYLVTNRRIAQVPEIGSTIERLLEPPLSSFVVKVRSDGSADASLDCVTFERVTDWQQLSHVVAGLPRQTVHGRMHRGQWLRKRRRSIAACVNDAKMNGPTIDNDTRLPLLDGEAILWRGQPRPRDPIDRRWLKRKLTVLFWMLIPTAVLVVTAIPELRPKAGAFWVAVAIAVVWITVALHSLISRPMIDMQRRKRTSYFVTGSRAITVEPMGKSVHLRCVFLDALGPQSELIEQPDGSGEINFGFQLSFKAVENAREVQRKILHIVQAAGGTPVIPTRSLPEDDENLEI